MIEQVCTECEYIGKPRLIKRGSSGMEWFLWLMLFFPGPFYSLWRILNQKKVCGQCGGTILTSMDSRIGRIIAEKQGLLLEEEDGQLDDMASTDTEVAHSAHEEWEKIQKEIKQDELAKHQEQGKTEKSKSDEW